MFDMFRGMFGLPKLEVCPYCLKDRGKLNRLQRELGKTAAQTCPSCKKEVPVEEELDEEDLLIILFCVVSDNVGSDKMRQATKEWIAFKETAQQEQKSETADK